MLPDRVSNPGPLTYESGALPINPFLTNWVAHLYHLDKSIPGLSCLWWIFSLLLHSA